MNINNAEPIPREEAQAELKETCPGLLLRGERVDMAFKAMRDKYYFTSHRDGISLWVIGPQLGQFIAGIRNAAAGDCAHGLGSGWTYASRAGVWEDDDPSLAVRCHNNTGSTITTTTATTTTVSTTTARAAARRPKATVSSGGLGGAVDCVWGEWSGWSECSRSCDGGETTR